MIDCVGLLKVTTTNNNDFQSTIVFLYSLFSNSYIQMNVQITLHEMLMVMMMR